MVISSPYYRKINNVVSQTTWFLLPVNLRIRTVIVYMMIKAILITDSHGSPFYSRSVNDFEELNENLFSGLIGSIGNIGKQLFQQKLATINFGETDSTSHLVIITKEIFSEKKLIYFAFFVEQDCNHILLKDIAAQIFIDTKPFLLQEKAEDIKDKVNEILDRKYSSLSFCQ